jgi:AcrR family transcriptional regulator
VASPESAASRRAPGAASRRGSRKESILAAAALAFAERGYRQVGMEEIAAAVGVSGPALYRHFPSKYAVFAQCATSLTGDLLEEWPPAPLGVDLALPEPALAHLHAVYTALARTTLRTRRSGSIYRWEGRYLAPEDRETVRLMFEEIIARVAALIRSVRPELSPEDVDVLTAGSLSVVASLTAHRTSLPTARITSLIVGAATRAAFTRLAAPPAEERPAPAESTRDPDDPARRSRRAVMLDSAVHQFSEVGFAEVTVEAIAAEAGLTPSGFYRHYASKSDVLLAACLQASEHLDAAVEASGFRGAPPDVALDRLARAYVAHSFSHHEQMWVYYANVASLPEADQARLRALQREHVGLWVTLLRARDPGLGLPEARFLAMAAISTVTDLGRRVRWRDDAGTRGRVQALITQVLASS